MSVSRFSQTGDAGGDDSVRALLELRGVGIAVALLAEGGEHSRPQDGPLKERREATLQP